jgi:hypothetical protein
MSEIRKEINEKRNSNRVPIDSQTFLISFGQKEKINCLTCNVSEGGISILTDRELSYDRYNIIMANQKFPVRIIYKEQISELQFIYGMKFTRPISMMLTNEIVFNLNKKKP